MSARDARSVASGWRTKMVPSGVLCGLSGTLAHPVTGGTAPTEFVVERLLDHVQAALLDAGDADAVACGVQRILSSGTGPIGSAPSTTEPAASRTSYGAPLRSRQVSPSPDLTVAVAVAVSGYRRGRGRQDPLCTRNCSSDLSVASGITIPAATPVRR
jgi:hypothetical protein